MKKLNDTTRRINVAHICLTSGMRCWATCRTGNVVSNPTSGIGEYPNFLICFPHADRCLEIIKVF